MKIGMIMGITGGVIALLFGIILFGGALIAGSAGGMMGESGLVAASGILGVIALGLPILSIVGGALVYKNPKGAAICMAIPAVAFAFLAIGASNIVAFIPGALMGIGAIAVVLELRKNSNDQAGVGST